MADTPQTIVITGASDGIGAVAARELAAAGHHVVMVGRSPEKTYAVARAAGIADAPAAPKGSAFGFGSKPDAAAVPDMDELKKLLGG